MTPPAAVPPVEEGSESADAPVAGRSRSRVVLYSCVGVAVVLAVFIAVLASAKPSTDSASSPLLGKQAPAISGRSLTGSAQYSLAQFSGKWVVVNFSASWCVPCRQETPQLARFYTEHEKSGNATILAVAFDPADLSNLAAFLKSSGATWPSVDDLSAEVAYGVKQIPQSYLVSPSGKVVASFLGGLTASQLDKSIAKEEAAQ